MPERPIIFSTDMVRAILEGRKTQTRRVIKPQPGIGSYKGWVESRGFWRNTQSFPSQRWKCLYTVGDRLWVRETWLLYNHMGEYVGNIPKQRPQDLSVGYKADGIGAEEGLLGAWPWRSPYHMPKWAACIWLEVTGVRVERVGEITWQDIALEGIRGKHAVDTRETFVKLWDSLNAKRDFSWESNPWVWVIEFKRSNDAD